MAKLQLTLDKIAQLEKYMEMGAPMKDIFAASGVAKSTYYRWMSIGRALAEEDFEYPDIPQPSQRRAGESHRKFNKRLRRHEEGLKLYVMLYERIQKADANARIKMVTVIRSAALNGDWRAALAWLERRDPDNWMPKRILRNSENKATHDQHQHSLMEPHMVEFMRILGQTERRLSKEREDDIRAGGRNGADSQPKAE